MDELPIGELKYDMRRRRKKLVTLRYRMNFVIGAMAVVGVMMLFPLRALFREGQTVTGTQSLESFTILVVMGVVILMLGSFYRTDKRKYDDIRASTRTWLHSSLPICKCQWPSCDCKENFTIYMYKKYHINLSY
jgi:hypothetical protein